MLSTQTIRVLIAGALLIHGIAHAIALGTLFSQAIQGPSRSKIAVRSWMLPTLSPRTAATAALPFWLLSTPGFLAAAASFLGVLVAGGAWRWLAVAGAIVSVLGIAFLSGNWPGSPGRQRSILNTFVALAMNTAILVALLWLGWPPQALFGR